MCQEPLVFRESRLTPGERPVRPCMFLDCHLVKQGIGKPAAIWGLALCTKSAGMLNIAGSFTTFVRLRRECPPTSKPSKL